MHKTIYPIFLLVCTLAVTGPVVQAQLLSPDEFLPHRLGEQFTEHSMLVAYYEHVAANSDRVQLEEFGRTNEGRPQLLAIVSSPANLSRIDDIRLDNLRRAGLAAGKVKNTDPIAIVWLGFSVHGNEAAGSEASMQVLYELADPSNARTGQWLENTVVLIEPSVNPDGYSRYTSWYRQVSPDDPDPNPIAREHNEPWPGGRVNHYYFDLNRDWAWCTQVESQNRIAVYNQWLPHVAADLHEQYYNSPYYFAPAAQPYHQYLTDWQADFQIEIGQNHARYFDKEGWLYFTREIFDLFYPSYGDTYPCFNGAIGMTYEQGGHARAGRAILLPNGDTLTLYDRIAHHTTTALSTVEVSSENAGRLVANFADYYSSSKNNPPGEYKTFVVKSHNPAYKIKSLTQLLDRHTIRYGRAGKSSSGLRAFDYSTGKETQTATIAPDDLLISAYQPKGLLTQVLLEPEPKLTDSLTYDITAWSLLHAYGLDGYALKQRLEPSGAWLPTSPNVLEHIDKTPYAYLLRWNSMPGPKVLSTLLKNGVVVRYAESPFTIEGTTYGAGTLVVTKADNRKHPRFDQTVLAAAARFGAELVPVQTGFVEKGQDFGSSGMHLITAPKVLVLSGEKTNNNEFGQVWFYFDREVHYPATIIDTEQLSSLNLSDFNTLVLPEGYFGFNEKILKKINAWVKAGGRLIAIGRANQALAGKEGFALKKYATEEEAKAAQSEAERIALDHRKKLYKNRQRSSIADNMPGAVMRVKMDTSHPLAFGLHDYFFSLKTNSSHFDLLKGAWNVGYLEKDYRYFGFIGSNLKNKLGNTVAFAVEDKGRGKIVYLIDNPLFRSFWEEGKLLFSNAVFF